MGLTMCIKENVKIKNEIINPDFIEQIPNEKNKENESNNNNIYMNNNNKELVTSGTKNIEIDKKEEKNEKESDIMSVNSIIPEQKLHSRNNNEIMFIGDLEQFENEKIITSFATLTRLKLNFYENKAQFISMRKPISSLNLNKMLNADLMKNNDNKILLCITLLENDEKKIYHTKTKELLFKWLCVLNYFIPLSQMD
jgi:hypothetical protein